MWTSGQVDTGKGAIAYWRLDLSEPWAEPGTLPVVFQHGLGLNSQAWRPWLKRIGAYHPVVGIDMRGHGGSAGAWTQDNYALDDFTNDILAVLDKLGIPACHFIGESFGGTVGLHLAARHPGRVASLVCCSTGIYGGWISNIATWPDLVFQPGGVAAWSREISGGRFDPARTDPALMEWVARQESALKPQVVAGLVRCLQGADLRPELKDLPTPLLVISPVGSPFVDLRAARTLQELVPLCEVVYVRAARHGAILSHWQECARAAGEFIARVEAQRKSTTV